jgi:hypothetical protein
MSHSNDRFETWEIRNMQKPSELINDCQMVMSSVEPILNNQFFCRPQSISMESRKHLGLWFHIVPRFFKKLLTALPVQQRKRCFL